MKAKVFFPPANLQRDASFKDGQVKVAEAFWAGRCIAGPVITVADSMTSLQAAEEVFELSNHPGRQDEREKEYGRGRSLSTGDIVLVGDDTWMCKSFGWGKI